jgi:DNA polymerase V
MGFPSPATDYKEEVIDLTKEIVKHPAATFYFRVKGDSMINASIPNNALLVIDRSIKASSGMIVVATLNGEFTVRRLIQTRRMWILHPENASYKPLPITEEMNMLVWGVVIAIIVQPLKLD